MDWGREVSAEGQEGAAACGCVVCAGDSGGWGGVVDVLAAAVILAFGVGLERRKITVPCEKEQTTAKQIQGFFSLPFDSAQGQG